MNGELVHVWRRVKKNRSDKRTTLATHRWYGQAIVVGKEMNNVFVSCRGRVTKVAPECFRKASVAEQMSWDITTKQKTLFESALDEESPSWEEPLLDDSGDCPDAEMTDTAVKSPSLEEEVNFFVNDDDDVPVSEPPITENEDHSENEPHVEESDPVTEKSRGIVHDQLRRRLTSKQPRSTQYGPKPSHELEEGMQSSLKRRPLTCLSCYTMRFS